MAPKTRVNCVAPGFVPTRFAEFITSNEAVVRAFLTTISPVFLTTATLELVVYVMLIIWCHQRNTLLENSLLKRLGTAEDMAAAAAFLASDDASYITGETLVVAGGTQSRL